MGGHCTDDQLVLYYYGEARWPHRIERHLQSCDACRANFRGLAGTLDAIVDGVPERDERYGLEVWQRIRPELPLQEPASWNGWVSRRLAVLAAAGVLVVAAFVSGQLLRDSGSANPSGVSGPFNPSGPARPPAPAGAVDRARFAAIGDHLERSERVLLDVINASGRSVNLANEQAWARELLDDNRLYRESAAEAGDQDIALVLDDLERSLLDIVHEPSAMTREELQALEVRLGAAALLFKVRVLADELREREQAPPSGGAQGNTI